MFERIFGRRVRANRQARPAAPRRAGLRLEGLEDRDCPAIAVQFDYSRDLGGFFSDPTRRAVLQQAANDLTSRLDAQLGAITSTAQNSLSVEYHDPAADTTRTESNVSIPADTVVVYVGARDLSELARGGFGGYAIHPTDPNYLAALNVRGPNLPLFSNGSSLLWGGSITFDTTPPTGSSWYFGSSASGIGSSQYDFYTTAMHELGHVLGIGTSVSWFNQVSSTQFGQFTGTNSQAIYGGPVPVSLNHDHWADGVTVNGQPVTMDPTIPLATRVPFTTLDDAGLQDVGWALKFTRMAPSTATLMTSDAAGNLYAAFPGGGTWRMAAVGTGGWSQLSASTATLLTVDDAGNLFATFGSSPGVWKYPAGGSSWSQVNPTTATLLVSDAIGTLFATFGAGSGTWQMAAGGNQNNWSQVNPATATLLEPGANGELYAAFGAGGGTWRMAAGQGVNGWSQVNVMTAAVMSSDAAGNLYAAFGAGGGDVADGGRAGRQRVVADRHPYRRLASGIAERRTVRRVHRRRRDVAGGCLSRAAPRRMSPTSSGSAR